MKEAFSFATLVSCYTFILCKPTTVDDVMALLKFMTQDDVWLHDIPRLLKEVRPYRS